MLTTSAVVPALAFAASAAAYVWPNRLVDEIEHLMIDNAGYNNGGYGNAVTPCSRYISSPLLTTGRESAAQWQRVLFHDLTTADVGAGVGGIDASIGFETGRPENSGAAMNDSLSYWAGWYNKYAGMADLLALGTVVSSAACSGPTLQMRAGRIDATQGGAFGVPEPDMDLPTTLSHMARAGYNQTAMIQFTACGHTIGSVHHGGFPLIVPASAVTPNNTNGGITFDDTVDVFDNHVVTQYLDGTTKNPLVMSANVSQRSDLRLYISDNNATMKDLAKSNDHFLSVCQKLYQQAIDTVPRTVSMQDVTPQAVKPVNIRISVTSSGVVTFSGAIRLLGTQFAASLTRTVTIAWTGTDKKVYTTTAVPTTPGFSLYLNAPTYYYTFSASVPKTGVSTFGVVITDGGKTTTYLNGGQGFPVVDTVQWLPAMSNFTVSSATNILSGRIAAAVQATVNPQTVNAVISLPVPQQGAMNPTIQTITVPLQQTGMLGKSGYALFQSPAGASIQLATGVNVTARAVSLAQQATLDIVLSTSGGPPGPPHNAGTVVDDFRKVSEIGIAVV